ncbi:MAG TPA: hydantoinase/oxoprolinase family protein [Nakamurella sp.]|nr:hydantoinase/oxoprolinase family protein [Nakamurella sp.]
MDADPPGFDPVGDDTVIAPMMRLGVDVGGTFTDVVTVDTTGRVVAAKVPSTPRDSSSGVIAGWQALDEPAERVEVFAHGTTVATNALLERRGGRTALVTTEGFRDLIQIGRQDRASLYDLTRHRPPPLVPRELRFVVRERMGPGGVVRPLDPASLGAAVEAVAAAGVDAVAVCLLFGFLHPAHERAVGRALRARLPDVAVSLSCEVLPEFREYERMSTTVADAYLRPRLSAYLRRLEGRSAQVGLPEPLVMQSSGGVADAGTAARHPARFVLSGPAGGVVGASHVARLSGYPNVLTFDMGGTSTDVAPVVDGRVQLTSESVVAGVPLRLPMVDVHTVSAGGGSIAWVDEGGALRVGPRSAASWSFAATWPSDRSPVWASGSVWTRGRRRWVWCGSRTPRWSARCGWSASSVGWTRGTSRSSRSAARAGCMPARWPMSWAAGPCWSPARPVSCRRSAWQSRRSGAITCGRSRSGTALRRTVRTAWRRSSPRWRPRPAPTLTRRRRSGWPTCATPGSPSS